MLAYKFCDDKSCVTTTKLFKVLLKPDSSIFASIKIEYNPGHVWAPENDFGDVIFNILEDYNFK